MFCPFCGKQLPDVARFCAGCGQSLPARAPKEQAQTQPEHPEPTNQPAQPVQQANPAIEAAKPAYRPPSRFARVMTGKAVKGIAKVVATIAVAGGFLALTWTPVIRPVLMSKTIGPVDQTGYTSKLNTQAGPNDARFPNGKWVRKDRTAVLHIGREQAGDNFLFDLHAASQAKSTAGDGPLQASGAAGEAEIKTLASLNPGLKAYAEYPAPTGDGTQASEAMLAFGALANEEAIEVTASNGWLAAHPGEVSVDGTYYRIRQTWFWVDEESGKWDLKFIPGVEDPPGDPQETPDIESKTETFEGEPSTEQGIPVTEPPVIRVNPPPVSERTPRRVTGGGQYISAEQMEILAEQGFYARFKGTYLVVSADATDDLKFFNYYYEEAKNPDKEFCIGTEDGLRCAEMRMECLTQSINSIFGSTEWAFATKVSFMPEFASLHFEEGGRFVREVELTNNGKARVGYELNEIQWTNKTDNSWFKTDWNSKDPFVYRVTGGLTVDLAKANKDNVADQLEYNLNFYFLTDGTAEAEGFLTLHGLGTEKIVYWVQMAAEEFQVDYEYRKEFSFKAAEYEYSFDTLDEDVPEFSAEREMIYRETGDNYDYKRYEYESAYQAVQEEGGTP